MKRKTTPSTKYNSESSVFIIYSVTHD